MNVLVTGGAGYIGSHTAVELIEAGYNAIIVDDLSNAKADVVDRIETITGKRPAFYKLDCKSKDALRTVFSAHKIDAIIHFAGIYMLDSLVELGTEEYDRIFDVNVRGAFLVNKIFLPHLRPGSKILITTSELAPLDPLPFTGIYAVTKAALDKYAYSLRMELQLLGIKVIQIRPGAVDTGMLGVSTAALDRFCNSTSYYSCNAKRFKKIVKSVEARSVKSEKIASKTAKILAARSPKYIYKINSNPLLVLLSVLPKRVQTFIIKMILK